jgi:hypothetical protein
MKASGPSRKALSAVSNFLKENLTAVKNFAEYPAPGPKSDAAELKSGEEPLCSRLSTERKRDRLRWLLCWRLLRMGALGHT